jgi:hypothetical protein
MAGYVLRMAGCTYSKELRDGWICSENCWLDVARSSEMAGYVLRMAGG